MLSERLRAACDLLLPSARSEAGLHHYDGIVQDLSPAGVKSALARLGEGAPPEDPHDAAHLAAFEHGIRVRFEEAELHRRSPRLLLENLDLSDYAREYAPLEERLEARQRHVAAWPEAIDAALASLDALAAPTAEALLPSVRGLTAPLEPHNTIDATALVAHARLVGHLERAARDGDPDPALGGRLLERLMGAFDATDVDLGALTAQAEAERDRLTRMLVEGCAQVRPGVPVPQAMAQLTSDHPDADGVLDAARDLTDEVLDFTIQAGLFEDGLDGEVRVAPSPPSRRWTTAMLSWAAPFEDDGPSWYLITPPAADWPAERRDGWLAAFSRTGLPATTAHEVAPGHFAHARALRRAPGDVRRALHSPAFVEGWAHYGEELMLEEGFHAGDARFAIGVAAKALMRVVRLLVAIGMHTGELTVDEAAAEFTRHAHLREPAARAEAGRATFDPTYGRYTWGKLVLRDLQAQARSRWGAGYTNARFHRALLDLGAPPLGLAGAALDAPR